ncbi:ankyrin repeat-containing protein BDA1-like [Actinidia eriantha]|uniref:ankyrin repeat-containing protein BDA1-like n=1 Tax=Actinidia eriantha TaxID=165200 RepID=UPI00258AFB16|nr:ankyrin repeat-containing protein BDA1-like [Actinidia eriantha]
MDRRLMEAARTGNVDALMKLLEEDPLLLHSVALAGEGCETPLHIASMAGQLHFVQQILKLRQHQFETELNQDGFSPLHIASANGYLEIVKEILKVVGGLDLCRLQGREGRIPLHCAAIKGRVQVMKELLDASPDSVEDVTARRETALHLAVKNNQFQGLRLLVAHLNHFKKEGVLNNKDGQGNTILHLAVSRKQYEASIFCYFSFIFDKSNLHFISEKDFPFLCEIVDEQVVDLLLGEYYDTKAAVDVNSLNNNGLTALDSLLLFQSEAGDREIEEILRQAGGSRARDLHTSVAQTGSTISNQNQDNQPAAPEQSRGSLAKQVLEYFKYNKARDSPSEIRNAMLVVTILIATATYQAVLSPPGGVWQDDSIHAPTKAHTAGKSIMASKRTVPSFLFFLFNSVGFFVSVNMIFVLTSGFPLQLELQIAMFALIVTYNASLTALAPSSDSSVFFFISSIITPFMIPIATVVARNYPKGPRECTSRPRQSV